MLKMWLKFIPNFFAVHYRHECSIQIDGQQIRSNQPDMGRARERMNANENEKCRPTFAHSSRQFIQKQLKSFSHFDQNVEEFIQR